MTSSVNNVNGDGGNKADNDTVLWGPENVEDAHAATPQPSTNQKDPLDKELDQYQTDQQLMQQKEQKQKAQIYRGTRTKYSPAVKKWRKRQ